MKIVTVNIPESYIEAIEKLVGEKSLYPSRSELVRMAVREFLIKELKIVKEMKKHKIKSSYSTKEISLIEEKSLGKAKEDEKEKKVVEAKEIIDSDKYKVYKVIKILDNNPNPKLLKASKEIIVEKEKGKKEIITQKKSEYKYQTEFLQQNKKQKRSIYDPSSHFSIF